jgi:tetratricopeptide (TPR) repeat protein
LLREDLFSGYLSDDMDRFSRGEKNIEVLLAQRPAEKPFLLAWKGSATLFHAVRAYEANRNDEFIQKYQQALDLFAEADRLRPGDGGVAAVTGGSFAVFGDRLPKEYRVAAWSKAYDSYSTLWKQQAPVVDKLPVHIRGELLAGLAQSAQRTGRNDEMNQYLDKIIEVLPNSPYEPIAKKWKTKPSAAVSGAITCLTCHDQGRLSARLSALDKK